MTRYDTISAFDSKIVDYQRTDNKSFDPSITDDSFYVPESELIKRLRNGVSYGQSLNVLYDFVDGKDTGMAVPITRRPGIDRAEVSEYLRSKTDIVTELLKDEARKQSEDTKHQSGSTINSNSEENNASSGTVNNSSSEVNN